MTLDLSHISLAQVVILLLGVAAVDTVSGIGSALATATFSWSQVATFLETHVLKRVFPIAGLVLISQLIPAGTAQQAVWTVAWGGLAAYVVETIASLTANLNPAPSSSKELVAPPEPKP